MTTARERFIESLLSTVDQYEHEKKAAVTERPKGVSPAMYRLWQAARARTEWKRYEAKMPEIIADISAETNPQFVASALGVTDSYVYRKLREHRAQQ